MLLPIGNDRKLVYTECMKSHKRTLQARIEKACDQMTNQIAALFARALRQIVQDTVGAKVKRVRSKVEATIKLMPDGRYELLSPSGKAWSAKRRRDMVRQARVLGLPVKSD